MIFIGSLIRIYMFMKHILNAFPEHLIEKILLELNNRKKENCWRSSQQVWQSDILEGNLGSCLSAIVSEQLHQEITAFLKERIEGVEKYMIQFYIWQKGSGIGSHTDEGYKIGATLYLNKDWNINHGGTFIWEDSATHELKALNPVFNSLVVNDEKETHLVTTVSSTAPEDRYTLQIWGIE